MDIIKNITMKERTGAFERMFMAQNHAINVMTEI
jgi:hypothetical protein